MSGSRLGGKPVKRPVSLDSNAFLPVWSFHLMGGADLDLGLRNKGQGDRLIRKAIKEIDDV